MTSLIRLRRDALRVVVIGVLGFSLFGCATSADPLVSLRSQAPNPELTPREVVEIQIEALGAAAESDEGIGIAFRFASPENRASTGPVDRFAAMLRRDPYAIMLEYETVEYAPLIVQGDVAVQRVRIVSGDLVTVFDFILQRQSSSRYLDCWMTDSVILRGVGRISSPTVV